MRFLRRFAAVMAVVSLAGGVVAACHGVASVAQANQEWAGTYAGNGYWDYLGYPSGGGSFVGSIYNFNAGSSLDVPGPRFYSQGHGPGNPSGAQVQLWSCDEGANQQWHQQDNGDGSWSYSVDDYGTNYCLDSLTGRHYLQTPVEVYPCSAGNAQKWTIGPEGQLQNVDSPGLCADATGFGTSDGTQIHSGTACTDARSGSTSAIGARSPTDAPRSSTDRKVSRIQLSSRLGSVADMRTPDELRAAFTPVRTARLLLRAVSPGDVDAVFAIHGNRETYRFHPDGVARSREESAAQLAGWQREWREVGFGFWAITVATDPRVVGFGGLTRRTFRERSVLNTYYRFDPSAWGHGYATEMAAAAAALARELLPDFPMIVRTRAGNLAAQAVAQKLGLVRAVELDDHLLTYVSRWNP